MLRAVGVRPALQQFEPGGDISTWRQGKAGDWDLLANGYGSPTGLAVTMVCRACTRAPRRRRRPATYHGYVFPAITRQIVAASSEVDDARRTVLLEKAQRDIWETWPAMWAFAPKAVVARRNRVGGLHLGANNSYDITAVRLEA